MAKEIQIIKQNISSLKGSNCIAYTSKEKVEILPESIVQQCTQNKGVDNMNDEVEDEVKEKYNEPIKLHNNHTSQPHNQK